ncbi:aldehyde dehydrogenase family protein [Tropicibacter sp. R16_0]|uniref:aldehyde dehydrogenase family protein n=1 Tax=Tropicibacter sp. R16_0 TaxID=2821102 RepID=UPI001ADC776B|nr:aldehyde dehydrogenase family protein [Tropicibacter sp. R16_0]MBO9453411.1 aldehyde dehydrogenase family protein [Tropicibacter sp. R16_0]
MHIDVERYLNRFNVLPEVRTAVSQIPKMFINGDFTDGQATGTKAVMEPSTGQQLTEVLLGSTADVDAAVASARATFDSGIWSRMAPNERQNILLKLADLMERDADILAQIETIDNGKAIGPCKDFDVLGSADLFRFMAGWATKIEGATKSLSVPGDFFSYTLREPIGVVAAIAPWNWPLNMSAWKIAAPLAAGCTIVLKTAAMTPLSMTYFARLTQEAGFPPGVLNIVTGEGSVIGDYLARHPGVDKVSFTGSTEVGKSVALAAASHLVPATLELGGKSPMVVFEDTNLDDLAEATRWSIYFNAGQNCSAGSRLYLHRSIFDDGVKAIKDKIAALSVCAGLDPACDVGPVISQGAQQSIGRYLEMGKRDGDVIFGGDLPEGPGYFVNPTLIALDDNTHPLVQEEIFGPVLVAVPFDEEEEVIAMANDNAYGLGASVWSENGARAQRVSRQLQSGSVWINCHDVIDSATAFGGVKQSGYGKDLGREQLEAVLITKTITMQL